MKKIYTAFFPVFLLLVTACKKDHPDIFRNQLIGDTWVLYETNAGNSFTVAPFVNGYYTFKSDGRLEYQDKTGTYEGDWQLYHDQNTGMRSMGFHIKNYYAITEIFDNIEFTEVGHFTATIITSTQTYKLKFKR